MSKARSKSEEKRIQILDAAVELFTERGFSNTSMDQIARQAGVSKQTVYSHFGNKEDLFVGAVGCKCAAHAMTPELFEPHLDLHLQLLDIARQFTALLQSREAIQVLRTCMSEAKTYPQLSRLFYDAGPKRLTSMMSQLLAQLDSLGRLRVPDTRFAAVQFLKMVQGELQMQLELNTGEPIADSEHQRYLENCVSMFLRAYAA
uniref:TetR/AcrR family transcriptional regulator n=1 Tax=Marinobacterium profundum TaxID=1714300 RepID=UPI000830C113|nr:TetR/AcrR family transcriptional regulator [Marinobacterium profundum]